MGGVKAEPVVLIDGRLCLTEDSHWKESARAQIDYFGRKHAGFLVVLVAAVPFSAMAVVSFTVATCHRWWRSSDHAIEGVVFPAISQLGVEMPERLLYQVGFAVGGGLMSVGMVLYDLLMVPVIFKALSVLDPQKKSSVQALVKDAIRWGLAAAAGVVVQGVFTLELGMSVQNFVHWGGAVLFMAGAMNHAKASDDVYAAIFSLDGMPHGATAWSTNSVFNNRFLTCAATMRSVIKKYSSVVLFAIPLLAQAVPSNQSEGAGNADEKRQQLPADPAVVNMMGLMQWVIIFEFAIYFLTYAADLGVVAKCIFQRSD